MGKGYFYGFACNLLDQTIYYSGFSNIMVKDQFIRDQPTDHFRYIPEWARFFEERNNYFKENVAVLAYGGTLDSIITGSGKLSPTHHPVNISTTRNHSAVSIYRQLQNNIVTTGTMGGLYKWTADHDPKSVPWSEVNPNLAGRVASFDSGQEGQSHFVAETFFGSQLLIKIPNLLLSEGTDSLAKKVALDTITQGRLLAAEDRKIIHFGSPESGYTENSLAPNIVKGALYTACEEQLPGGVYVVSASRMDNGEHMIQIHSGLSCVKLHSDGYFHSPNSGPLLSIYGGNVYKHAAFDKYSRSHPLFRLTPDFAFNFLLSESSMSDLEELLTKVAIESVENDPRVLDFFYKIGKRIFVIKARGVGNASPEWKEAIERVVKRKNSTVMIITLADQGDVDLKKYEAGLDIESVISGRTLREETAVVLSALLHDLKHRKNVSQEDLQKLIEKYCQIFGMI